MQFVPYLNYDGRCRQAFEFYQRTLGGTLDIFTFGQAPDGEGGVPPEMRDLVMNATLIVGDAMLMASDAPGGRYEPPSGTWVSIVHDDEAETDRIWAALADGGEVVMPYGPTFWAKRFGMVKDRFGTPWMLNCGVAAEV